MPFNNKKIFFITDFHLGMPDAISSRQREQLLISWLDEVSVDAQEIYIMGDVFDFWFEYKSVVPKGYVRLLGKLAELTDKGLKIHLFKGNHDLWAFNYLQTEVGLILHRAPEVLVLNNKKFYLVHGDGLGPSDKAYRFLKKIFECRLNQILFSWIHPDLGIRIAMKWSHDHRVKKLKRVDKSNLDYKSLPLFKYAQSVLNNTPDIDYFVFGHNHTPVVCSLGEHCEMYVIGNWIFDFTYAVWDGQKMELRTFKK